MRAPRALISERTIPVLPRGVQLRQDFARQRWVLLAPERILVPDALAHEILLLCDGRTSVSNIADILAQKHRADRDVVLRDVLGILQGLQDKQYLTDCSGIEGNDVPDLTRLNWQGAAETAGSRLTSTIPLPIAALAEITHRCPLQCPYCSNPVDLERASSELSTETWKRLIDEMSNLGVLQIHFSGGEPLVRKDLADLVGHAANAGLYVNLITSGVLLDRDKLSALANAGLSHVQISFQGTEDRSADHMAGFRGALSKKREAARLVREAGLPLTVNAVMHRQNLHQLPSIIDMAVELDAARLEVAHVQYLGWALRNRAALIPTFEQFEDSTRVVDAARERLKGLLVIDYVIPDYYAIRPKKCMGGWAKQFFNITPSGKVLPCHAAESITGLAFDSVQDHSLSWLWNESPAMKKFRGTEWMKEPCKSCEFRERDLGGCRCQAFALTGDAGATDPTCAKSPHNTEITTMATSESEADNRQFKYRCFS